MIIYSHPNSVVPPPWLVGAIGMSMRQGSGGFLYGIGPSPLLGYSESAETLEGGWKVHQLKDLNPFFLNRDIKGVPQVCVDDSHGRAWHAPIAIGADGLRAFKVKYGRDWKPALTEDQETLLSFAESSMLELPKYLRGGSGEREELTPRLCQWASFSLCYVNHITVEVIQALELMDDLLMVSVLTSLTSGVTLEGE